MSVAWMCTFWNILAQNHPKKAKKQRTKQRERKWTAYSNFIIKDVRTNTIVSSLSLILSSIHPSLNFYLHPNSKLFQYLFSLPRKTHETYSNRHKIYAPTNCNQAHSGIRQLPQDEVKFLDCLANDIFTDLRDANGKQAK